MSLTDEQIELHAFNDDPGDWDDLAHRKTWREGYVIGYRAAESAATAPLLERIAELEANEKVLLAQVQSHTQWRERIIKASEQAYGESAIRYKFSLTKSGKCMNTFPREIDGRWFALVPAEDDGHIGHIARIAELERKSDQDDETIIWQAGQIGQHLDRIKELEALRKDAERYRWLRKQNETLEINSWTITAQDFTDLDDPRRWWVGSDLDAAIDAAKEHV